MFRSVVFPAPLAPIIAVTLPDLKMPLIPLRIYLWTKDFLNGFLLFRDVSLFLTEYVIFSNTISIPSAFDSFTNYFDVSTARLVEVFRFFMKSEILKVNI